MVKAKLPYTGHVNNIHKQHTSKMISKIYIIGFDGKQLDLQFTLGLLPTARKILLNY